MIHFYSVNEKIFMKGDFVLNNNQTEPYVGMPVEMEPYVGMPVDVEPYVGMPVYLDDEFFKVFFIDEEKAPCDAPPTGSMREHAAPTDRASDRPGSPARSNTAAVSDSKKGNEARAKTSQEDDMWPNDCIIKCPLAMAYVPWQMWEEPYPPEEAIKMGTAFPSLNLPFMGGGAK